MLVVSSTSNPGCEAGCGLTVSWSDHSRIMVGSWSDHGRIILGSSPHWKWRFNCFQTFSKKFGNGILCGRRSIWWGLRVTPVAPRIVNDVSYVRTIKQSSHFVWQAQYLVRLDGDTYCSAHCKWRFICDQDQAWESFCLTGAKFGGAQVSLFVAGALLGGVLCSTGVVLCSTE